MAVTGSSGGIGANRSGGFDVSIVRTNAPVRAGDVFQVEAIVTNTGSESDEQTIRLVAGETVDTETMAVPPGESWPVTLSYETYPVRQDATFPITVASDDDSAERTVDVLTEGDGNFELEITSVNDPVPAGDVLRVRVEVRNTGSVTQTQEVRLEAGSTVDSQTTTVPTNEVHSFSLAYETYPIKEDATFPVTVSCDDDADQREVTVTGTN
ncbi:hypothetical protein OB955_06255 [Halobacteria archaeon AArc-m2/3/4]|uniref:CARDB protein n=1 Tax=Natronoglomus mannanivorans TaxID=2979990 RepID=A0AAP3E1A7_9EURY|nr:hypothetical protein [Halobacteria archaeon AArc-xg1-1]MCU4972337.1 hypothetical protein [Halobacteria archaeon AArc-m2/3/4]